MDWLWQQLQREWGVVRQAPILFGLTCGVGLIVIWMLVHKLYRSRIETRDELLQGYQEKMGLGPFKRRPYSKLKNQELKNDAVKLAQKIRTFVALAASQIKTDPANFPRFWPYIASQYSNEYKAVSILLRDEILLRISKAARATYQQADPKGMMAFVYQNPVHTAGMEMVANDLDKLVNLLPS